MPRSCLLLECLQAHCPYLPPLAFPLPTPGNRAGEAGRGRPAGGRPLPGRAGGRRPDESRLLAPEPSSRSSPSSKRSRESEQTRVRSAVRSTERVLWSQAQNASGHPRHGTKGGQAGLRSHRNLQHQRPPCRVPVSDTQGEDGLSLMGEGPTKTVRWGETEPRGNAGCCRQRGAG